MKSNNGNGAGWAKREQILMFSGLTLIGFVVVAVELFNRPFHFEFVLAGLALCGVAIAQVGDKR